ncbi:hypothetical protein OEZ86_010323 [Tetradesmus obliquus]|nr:hypothetical protein OEZ86_010323 [Tetradesmus obliquus]
MYGPALGGCIDADDIVWAYGQVVSRAFGDRKTVAFAPLIDMLNHKLGCGTPRLLTVPAQQASAEASLAAAAAAAKPSSAAAAGQLPLQSLLAAAAAGRAMSSFEPSSESDSDNDAEGTEAFASYQEPIQGLWCVCRPPKAESQQQQQQLVLAAGEELYISYVTRCDARAAYLNFGFVPPEQQ